MKKIISLLALALILVGCGTSKPKSEIHYISSVEAMQKMDNQESFFMVIGTSTCAACQVYKPTVEEVVKQKGAEIFYVETDTEAAKSETDLANVKKFFEEYLMDKVNATPTTIYIEKGKVAEIRVANIKYTELVDWVASKK